APRRRPTPRRTPPRTAPPRRLLEAGEPIADTAFATGFADQSHMHRHFERSLGLTPARYTRRFRDLSRCTSPAPAPRHEADDPLVSGTDRRRGLLHAGLR